MLIKIRTNPLIVIIVALCFSLPVAAQWQITGNRDANSLSLLGTTNGVPLRLGTKNLPRLFIDTTGKVGIGTVNPTHTLHIAGQVKIVDGTQGAGKVLTSDAAGLGNWTTPVSSPWLITGNNISSINTGNVGIGVATPTYKLDVSGDMRVNGIKIGKGKGSIINNTVLGLVALDSNTTGIKNTAIGYAALSKTTAGSENTGVGFYALQANTTGKNNTATGAHTLLSNTTGNNNIAVGDSALYYSTSANGNTATGMGALRATTIGSNNTAFGYKAGLTNTTGSTNTFIGYAADAIANNFTNAMAIGANAKVGASNAIVLGAGANVGIGTATPSTRLHVNGTVRISDGTQALGKVLTSDADGLSSWQIAPGSLWTLSGSNAYYSQSGNIGIGTSTPGAKLEVNNTLKFTNASPDGNDGIIGTAPYAPGLNIVGINTDATSRKINYWGSLIQNENNLGNLFVGNTAFPNGIWNDNGNVGLGTTDLKQRLTVNGNLQFTNATLPKSFLDELGGTSPLFTMSSNFHEANKDDTYRGAAYRIDLRDGYPVHNWFSRLAGSANENVIMALGENAGLSVGTTFASSYTAPNNGAIIQGNVGIGKTAPSWKLDVAGDIMANGGFVRVTGNAGLYFQDWGGGWNMTDATWIRTYNDKNVWAGNGLLGCNGGLTIGSGGATPSSGGASIAGFTSIGGGAAIAGYTSIGGGATITGGSVVLCNSLDISQGNVGIGSGPFNNCKLRVNTNQPYAIAVDAGGVLKPGGGSWGTISDKRLKKEINTYSDGLSSLLKIRPIIYRYNELSGLDTKIEYVGVIAQELKEIAPYMVKLAQYINSDKEYYSVDNSAMTYMLINAVKELKGQTDAKDETITKQQADIKVLQAQMNMLLQKMDALDAKQEACCTAANSKGIATEQNTSLSSASLEQNVPNPPANNATRIGYNIPKGTGKALLIIADSYGRKLKEVNLSIMGKGNVNVDTKSLAPGTYSYTLMVDGKMVDTKQMVVAN